ncbi:ABC transporter substrate-binding protein [Pendulispora rubella]|uniref:Probable sugar-binding periplasmic protein n=1 Tax=Pendulispora rubella TaxID=2741070 RepID=A0ABZ2LDL4_9BACT
MIVARTRFTKLAIVALLLGMGAVSCAEHDDGPRTRRRGQVEIFSNWTAGGEEEALEVIIDTYERAFPDVTVVNAAVAGGTKTREDELKKRMTENLPPDVFQVHGGRELIGAWVRPKGILDDSANKMEDVTFLFDQEGWRSAFPAQLLDIVSFHEKVYSVPINVHRGNAVFYNVRVFAEHGVAVPKTLDDLKDAAASLRAQKVTPIALGTKYPWPIVMMFEDLLLARGGSAFFRDYFAGKKAGDGPIVRAALEDLKSLFAFVNSDSATLSWDQAANKVGTGEAAMTFMGDWAKGFFISEKGGNMKPAVDFDAFPAPGTDGSFIVITDTFGLPKGATSRANAVELLRLSGGKELQSAFSLKKGSIPARKDIDVSQFDPMARTTIHDFSTGELVPSLAHGSAADEEYATSIGVALATFFIDRNVDKVLGILRATYARLQ